MLDAVLKALPGSPTSDLIEDLRFGLWVAAGEYRQRTAWQEAPPPSQLRKELGAVRRLASKLATRLGATDRFNPGSELTDTLPYLVRLSLLPIADRYAADHGGYPGLPARKFEIPGGTGEFWDHRGAARLVDTIAGLQLLMTWCDTAMQSSLEKATKTEKGDRRRDGGSTDYARHEGDRALDMLITRLGALYRHVTGRRPGIARTRSAAGKPGGPFFRFVAAVCGQLQIPLTAAALEKRWRKVGPRVHATDQISKKSDPTHSP